MTTAVDWWQSGTEAVLLVAHSFYLKPELSPEGIWGGSQCRNRSGDANFIIVFHSNCGSILLSFRDMAMDGQWIDHIQTSATTAPLAFNKSKHNETCICLRWPSSSALFSVLSAEFSCCCCCRLVLAAASSSRNKTVSDCMALILWFKLATVALSNTVINVTLRPAMSMLVELWWKK